MPMPKAAIYEYDCLPPREDEIGSPRKTSVMEPVSKAAFVKSFS